MINEKLRFTKGNAKLGKHTTILSLPAGHTCMGAKDCLARANRETGKLTAGKDSVFRCYAATSENLFKNVRIGRWNNFELLRGKSKMEMANLILRSLPKNISLCRIHSSGDFFSQDYFDAWNHVASIRHDVVFYAYTKALPFWIKRLGDISVNFRLVASKGGKYDNLIELYNLRSVTVVGTNPAISPEDEAKSLGLEIDHDDKLAWNSQANFAISLHGTQPAGTDAAKAWYKIKTQGAGGYKADYFAHYSK